MTSIEDAVEQLKTLSEFKLNNLEYEFTDYTSVPGYPLEYVVKGSLTMERKINTQIPDEDQAIEW